MSIDEIVKQLIALGEDADELQFWLELFPHLENNDQTKLYDNLANELTNLKK